MPQGVGAWHRRWLQLWSGSNSGASSLGSNTYSNYSEYELMSSELSYNRREFEEEGDIEEEVAFEAM